MVKLDTRIPDFYDNLLEGYYFKEIVRTILDISGYMVFPYGFESAFSYVKIQLHKGKIRDTSTVRRIRSSPDLLVYDADEKEVWLVEVKSRNWDDETSVLIDKIPWYQKYWKDSVLVVIIPHGHWFYAQYVSKLEEKDEYNLKEEFRRLEDLFTNINTDTLYHFKLAIAEKMKRSIDHAHYFPERDEKFFVPELLRLVKNNKGKTKDQLFDILNHDNLVSMKLFTDSLEKLVKEREINETKNRFYRWKS
jgi:hypothetical protein